MRPRIGTLITSLLVSVTVFLATGCQAPPQPEGITRTDVLADSQDEVNRLWEATESTLIRHFFTPDRRDRSAGLITTMPETSAAGFELWRPQPTPAYYWWEANLQTIRRQAEVRIAPIEDTGQYELQVQIDRYRYRLPERQVDNAAAALRLYGGRSPTLTGEMAPAERSGYWIHLGRDAPMEQKLLAAIVDRYQLQDQAAQSAH
jgi:hypothetical protein